MYICILNKVYEFVQVMCVVITCIFLHIIGLQNYLLHTNKAKYYRIYGNMFKNIEKFNFKLEN